MAKFDLANLKIQTPTEEVETTEVSTPVSVENETTIDSLSQTWADLKSQEAEIWEIKEESPTFKINSENERNLDKSKISRFIEHSKWLWKTREETQKAYIKWLERWAFDLKETVEDDLWDGGTFNSIAKESWFFEAWFDPIKSAVTEWLPQAGADIFEWVKRFWSDISKIKSWTIAEEVRTWEKQWGIKKWILWRIVQRWLEREKKFSERKAQQWNVGQSEIEKKLDIVWQGLWYVWDVFWEWFISALNTLSTEEQKKVAKKAIKDVVESDLWKKGAEAVKQWWEAFKEFESENPRVASQIRNLTNLWLTTLDVAWAWAWGKLWKETIENTGKQIDNLAENVVEIVKTNKLPELDTTIIKEWVDTWLDKAWELAWEIAWRKAKWLDIKAKEQIRSEAEEIALPTIDELNKKWRWEIFKDVTESWDIIRTDREWVAIEEVSRLIDEWKINKGMTEVKKRQVIEKEIENISKELVEDLKMSDAKLTKDEMKWLFNELSEGILENPVLWNNKSSVDQLLKQLDKKLTKNDYFPEDILQLRKDLDSLVRKFKAETVFDPNIENAFTVTLRDFRQWLNNKVSELVPDANVRKQLDRQSGLFEVNKTLQDRFAWQGWSFVKKTLQSIENFTWIPRTEIVELITALWLIGVWTWIAVPIWITAWVWALWLKGIKSLWKASNKKKISELLKSFDNAVSKNPNKADEINNFKNQIINISKDKKLKERSIEERLDLIQKMLDATTPSTQKKLPEGKIEPIITPQTAERWIIQESKKGLWELKQPTTPSVEKARLELEDFWLDAIEDSKDINELISIKELINEADLKIESKEALIDLIDNKIKDLS